MDILDFRSDTVTQPTPEMRTAMAEAEVGDDVYGEDPTINKFQEMAASRMGKEAGLFVASGTMGNLAALLAHCQRGDEVILGSKAHTFNFEAGGLAALGGIQPHTVANQPDGTLRLEDVAEAIRDDDPHHPISRLVTIENTNNRCGGVSLSAEYTQKLGALAHEKGLRLHIDGARIFNAAVDQGVSACDLAAAADSITFCLSKGLAAPVGSVLCGPRAFIAKAHRARKMLGGGMRQAGILAAAGIIALETMTERLVEDHTRARRLAEGLSTVDGIDLDLDSQHTNMVFFKLANMVPFSIDEFIQALKVKGLLVGGADKNHIRMVTHVWIDDQAVESAVDIIRATLQKG